MNNIDTKIIISNLNIIFHFILSYLPYHWPSAKRLKEFYSIVLMDYNAMLELAVGSWQLLKLVPLWGVQQSFYIYCFFVLHSDYHFSLLPSLKVSHFIHHDRALHHEGTSLFMFILLHIWYCCDPWFMCV